MPLSLPDAGTTRVTGQAVTPGPLSKNDHHSDGLGKESGGAAPGRMLRDAGGIPAHGNQRAGWEAGCRFDYDNPDYR